MAAEEAEVREHRSNAPSRRAIRNFEALVTKVIRETHDTVTLVLATGEEPHHYRAGQFLTIDPHQFPLLSGFIGYLEEKKGRREPPRAYSLASAPYERHLAITIKEEPFVPGITDYPPLLSPLLVGGIGRGTLLQVSGFTGPYTVPDDLGSQTDHMVHLCAGSGSVPNFSMLKQTLIEWPRVRQTFVYSNKTWNDVIYRRQLEHLQQLHGHRLRVVHTLTREPDLAPGDNVRCGRIDRTLLSEVIPDPTASLIFTCGPGITPWDRARARTEGQKAQPRFLETVIALLAEIGVPKQRIKREAYG